MTLCKKLNTLVLVGLAVAFGALAEGGADSPARTVNRFHDALASGDRARALELLDPGIVIYESGGAELSRDEYASHHLAADMEFSAATTLEILEQSASVSGDVAWVLTRSATRGSFRTRDIDLLGVETALLRRAGHGWRIHHLHWSSRSRAAERSEAAGSGSEPIRRSQRRTRAKVGQSGPS